MHQVVMVSIEGLHLLISGSNGSEKIRLLNRKFQLRMRQKGKKFKLMLLLNIVVFQGALFAY